MKLSRFLSVTTTITLSALMYVHQQVGLVVTSYIVREKEENLSRLLEQNEALRYNIFALKSPQYLEETLMAENIDLGLPKLQQVVWLGETRPIIKEEKEVLASGGRRGLFFSLFALKSQAEAGTDIHTEKIRIAAERNRKNKETPDRDR